MKTLRHLGSLAFVLGLFTAVFVGIPWYVIVADDPVIPWWLRVAIFCLLGGILVVLLTLALEQWKNKPSGARPPLTESDSRVLLLNSAEIPGREFTEILGLAYGRRKNCLTQKQRSTETNWPVTTMLESFSDPGHTGTGHDGSRGIVRHKLRFRIRYVLRRRSRDSP